MEFEAREQTMSVLFPLIDLIKIDDVDNWELRINDVKNSIGIK